MPDETVTTENVEQTGSSAAEIDNLRKLAAERDQYLDMAQRTRAEFENYQKRARKERDDERDHRHLQRIEPERADESGEGERISSKAPAGVPDHRAERQADEQRDQRPVSAEFPRRARGLVARRCAQRGFRKR